MSSVGDSPASQLAAQEKGKAKKTRAGYGRSSAESFAAFGPNGCLSKMYRGCYLLTLEGSLLEYCETFPKAGTMQNGILYRLPALEPHTSEKGSSLWRTPNSKVIDAKSTVVKLTGRTPKDPQVGLADQVLAAECGMWPTPTKSDGMGGPGCSGREGGKNLRTVVQSFPTPRANDWKGGLPANTKSKRAECDFYLPDKVNKLEGGSGQLNPTWVEWLMGFPLGWTDLEHSEMP
ncbi:MAG: hypothetical protein PHD55_11960, partial [Methanoregula sp.]|nr:hypothetical protein [Methanoregula sp.]